MSLAKKMLSFLLMTAFLSVSLSAVHKVGNSAGWTTIGNVDYKKWASANKFHVGDVLSMFLTHPYFFSQYCYEL